MIKTLLKQLIIEECINTLFSNIHKNIFPPPPETTNYKFHCEEKQYAHHFYEYSCTLSFFHNNKETTIGTISIGSKKLKSAILEDQKESLIEEMNNILKCQ
jgi:hypothetical protein